MPLRGALRNHDLGGDRLFGQALGNQIGDLALPKDASIGVVPVKEANATAERNRWNEPTRARILPAFSAPIPIPHS
nr:hypothetical protein [Rhodococcus jostii]